MPVYIPLGILNLFYIIFLKIMENKKQNNKSLEKLKRKLRKNKLNTYRKKRKRT